MNFEMSRRRNQDKMRLVDRLLVLIRRLLTDRRPWSMPPLESKEYHRPFFELDLEDGGSVNIGSVKVILDGDLSVPVMLELLEKDD